MNTDRIYGIVMFILIGLFIIGVCLICFYQERKPQQVKGKPFNKTYIIYEAKKQEGVDEEPKNYLEYRAWLWANENKLLTTIGMGKKLYFRVEDLANFTYKPEHWGLADKELEEWRDKPMPEGLEAFKRRWE